MPPVDPFTHQHRRHTIADYDPDCCDSHDCDRHCHRDEPADDDRPVTVADLLDAYLSRDYYDGASPRHHDQYRRAHDDVTESYWRIRNALEVNRNAQLRLAALSPSERAEFDRRTTG